MDPYLLTMTATAVTTSATTWGVPALIRLRRRVKASRLARSLEAQQARTRALEEECLDGETVLELVGRINASSVPEHVPALPPKPAPRSVFDPPRGAIAPRRAPAQETFGGIFVQGEGAGRFAGWLHLSSQRLQAYGPSAIRNVRECLLCRRLPSGSWRVCPKHRGLLESLAAHGCLTPEHEREACLECHWENVRDLSGVIVRRHLVDPCPSHAEGPAL